MLLCFKRSYQNIWHNERFDTVSKLVECHEKGLQCVFYEILNENNENFEGGGQCLFVDGISIHDTILYTKPDAGPCFDIYPLLQSISNVNITKELLEKTEAYLKSISFYSSKIPFDLLAVPFDQALKKHCLHNE